LDRDERRAQILACARRLFSQRPYDAVSTAEIVHEAGVSRPLLHHYFGTKRELYLEVMRSIMQPPDLFPAADVGSLGREELLIRAVDRWLAMVERNPATWLATLGTPQVGRDPEVEAIYEESREGTASLVIAVIRPGDPLSAPPELRAVVRTFGALAERASVEWVRHHRLSREQVRLLLVDTARHLLRDVAPKLERLDPAGEPVPERSRLGGLAGAMRRVLGAEG
jgi:AcrR family transcriptional regulator